MPERNQQLFNRIADCIETWPEAYDQNTWWSNGDAEYVDVTFADGTVAKMVHCGTSQCIAGWALVLSNYEPRPTVMRYGEYVQSFDKDGRGGLAPTLAAEELGLNDEEMETLFDPSWGPNAMERLKTPQTRARCVARVLRKIGAGGPIPKEFSGEIFHNPY